MIHTKSGLHIDILTHERILLEDVIWAMCHMSVKRWCGQTAHVWTEGQHALLVASTLVESFSFLPATAVSVALCNCPLAYGLEPVKQHSEPDPNSQLVYTAIGCEKWWNGPACWQGIEAAYTKEYNELVTCTHTGTLANAHTRTTYTQFHKLVKSHLKPRRS